MRNVLLFIPPNEPDLDKWMVLLWRHCMRRHYQPDAVAHDWRDVAKLWTPKLQVVVACRDHVRWLEVISEPQAEPSQRQRRPHRTG